MSIPKILARNESSKSWFNKPSPFQTNPNTQILTTMKRFSIYILLLLASGLFFTACDNEDDDPKPQDTTNKVSMMMHYYYGDQMLDTSKTYTLTDAGGNDAKH